MTEYFLRKSLQLTFIAGLEIFALDDEGVSWDAEGFGSADFIKVIPWWVELEDVGAIDFIGVEGPDGVDCAKVAVGVVTGDVGTVVACEVNNA